MIKTPEQVVNDISLPPFIEVFKAPSALEFLPSPAIPRREPLLNTFFIWFSLSYLFIKNFIWSSLLNLFIKDGFNEDTISTTPIILDFMGTVVEQHQRFRCFENRQHHKSRPQENDKPMNHCLKKTNRSSEKETWVSLFPSHNDYGDHAEYLIFSGGTPQ